MKIPKTELEVKKVWEILKKLSHKISISPKRSSTEIDFSNRTISMGTREYVDTISGKENIEIQKETEKRILTDLKKEGVIKNLNFNENLNLYSFLPTDKFKNYYKKIKEIAINTGSYFPKTEDQNLIKEDYERMLAVGKNIAEILEEKEANKFIFPLYQPEEKLLDLFPFFECLEGDIRKFKENGLKLWKLRNAIKYYEIQKEWSALKGWDWKAKVEVKNKQGFLEKLEILKKKYEKLTKEKNEEWKSKYHPPIPQIIKQKISLSSKKIKYIDEQTVLEIETQKCTMPPNKNEHYFCRAMYEPEVKANEPISWDIIYKEITGCDADSRPEENKKKERMVYDAMNRLNKRIKKDVNTDDDLFSWQEKTVKRNY